MNAVVKVCACASGLLLAVAASAQIAQEPRPSSGRAERYQAIRVSDDRVLVIDTATGQCWSKHLGHRQWIDEGAPSSRQRLQGERAERSTRAERRARVPFLRLRGDEPVELTVRQREKKAIPGSDGTLFVHLGDITEGQVLVAVRDEAGKAVAGEKSLAQGQSLRFAPDGGDEFVVTIAELRNLLTGDDFAVLRISVADDSDGSDESNAAEEPAPSAPRG